MDWILHFILLVDPFGHIVDSRINSAFQSFSSFVFLRLGSLGRYSKIQQRASTQGMFDW